MLNKRLIVQTLIGAAKLIKDTGWCRGSYARDESDREVDVLGPNACKFCATGAIMRASVDVVLPSGVRQNELIDETVDWINFYARKTWSQGIVNLNDSVFNGFMLWTSDPQQAATEAKLRIIKTLNDGARELDPECYDAFVKTPSV